MLKARQLTPPVEAAVVTVSLLLGAWLRLRDGAMVAFNRDAGLLVSMADRLRAGESILLGIPSSKGIVNPPLSVYLVAGLESFGRSPAAITTSMAILQLMAIGLSWWVVRHYLGPRVAAGTAIYYATSGWAVLYCRILWPPCFAPVFSIAMLASLWAWTVDKRPYGLAAALGLAAIVSQLHLTGFAWFVLIVVVAVLYRPPIDRRALMLGLASVALLFLPFAIGLATRGIAAGTKRRALFVDFIGSPARFFLLSTTHGGVDFHFPTLDHALPDPHFAIIPWVAAILVAGGMVLASPRLRDFHRTPEFPWIACGGDPRTGIPFLFAVVPVGAMVVAGLDTSPHYLILQYPAAWIFLSLALLWVVDRSEPAAVGALLVAGSIAATGVHFTLSLQNWIDTRPPWKWSGGYSAPLGDQQAAIDWIEHDAAGAPVRLAESPQDTTEKPPFNFNLLLARANGALVRLEDVPPPGAIPYLLVDESNGGLSSDAREALKAKGARQFGALWVCRWQ